MEIDCGWFDRKYSGGKRPTIKDKFDLLSMLDIHLSERDRKNIVYKLQQALHELKREYSPGAQMTAHNILFCLGPFLGLESREYQEYVGLYNRVMKKHEGKNVFSENFQPEEAHS